MTQPLSELLVRGRMNALMDEGIRNQTYLKCCKVQFRLFHELEKFILLFLIVLGLLELIVH